MSMFAQLGKIAADNFIKQAAGEEAAGGGMGSLIGMFKKAPPAAPKKPKSLSPAEEYAKYQNQRMESSRGQLPNNYMEGVKKDFNNKENLKMKQEMKPTTLESVGKGMSNLLPAPRNKSPMESLLWNSSLGGRPGINFK